MTTARGTVAACCAGLISLVLAASGTAGERVQLRDLDGRLVDPFDPDRTVKGVVLLFVSRECPISNRYAPEIRRLRTELGPEGVSFWLVFPNPAESVEDIREHLAAFQYDVPALRDPTQLLVRHAGATMTPEAAVFDAARHRTYRGRIDDRYVRLGLMRPAATAHELRDALTALLAGRPAPVSTAPAVGCYISDFAHAH